VSRIVDKEVMAQNQPESGVAKLSLLERFADRMNPILVKETRQAMKSRAFVVTFMLLIACCWIISLVGAITVGASLEYYSYAGRFFASYFLPLAVAIGVVVPFLAYHSMLNERIDDTFEMLSITTLNARRIVNGKLTNAIVLILLCFSAITPFIAFTSLLQGFRMTPVVVTMTAGLFVSIGLCSVALMASTLARARIIQGIIAMVLLCGLGYVTSLSSVLFQPGFWTMSAGWSTYGYLAVGCLTLCCLVLLFREVAVARITFESDNRSSGIRLVCSLIVVLIFGGIYVFYLLNKLTVPPYFLASAYSFVSSSCLCLLILVGYFSCTEPPDMSKRVRQQVAKIPGSIRLFAIPWLPGCYHGYLFCLIHIVPIVLINALIWNGGFGMSAVSRTSWYPTNLGVFPMTIGIYALFYAGIATLITGIFYRRNRPVQSTMVRASFLVVIAFMAVLPHLVVTSLEEWRQKPIDYGLHFLTSPYATVNEALHGGGAVLTTVLYLICDIAVLLLLLNLRGIWNSCHQTMARYADYRAFRDSSIVSRDTVGS